MAWWKPWTAWVALAAGTVLLVIARALVRPGGDDRPGVVVALILLSLATVGVALVCAAVQRRPSAADFGLVPPSRRRAVAGVLALAAAMFVVATASTIALDMPEDPVDVTDRLAADSGALQGVLVLLLVAVATPLAEEFLFRAYAFRALVPWRGPVVAALLSAGVFTAFHLDWSPTAAFPPIALFGLGTCWLYVWSGSVYPPLAAHALLNSVSLAPAFDGLGGAAGVVAAVALTLGVARLIAVALAWRRPAPAPQPAVGNRSTTS